MMPQISKYKNKPLNLAVQTLFWCMKEEMKTIYQSGSKTNKNSNSQGSMQENRYQEYIDLLETNKNLILTGAPGTGKTFMAKAIAEEMGAEVGFVQFHPSYDYTDFVEGFRPATDEHGNVGFVRCDGVFKKFCKSALNAKDDNDKESRIGSTAWIYFLAYDDDLRKDCIDNGYIRIGWAEYGDIDLDKYSIDFDRDDEFLSYTEQQVLRAFQKEMKEDDLIMLCHTPYEVDAVGVVKGAYEYREEGGDHPRYRPIKWLAKNIKEVVPEKDFAKRYIIPTIRKSSMALEDVLKIILKHAPTAFISNSKAPTHIFIIDEINRGEISKIFGELLFSIDPGYRGEYDMNGNDNKVQTQYQNLIPKEGDNSFDPQNADVFRHGFYVPNNVYIIGTMNDIDRSVESMDFAMRRRFIWKEVTPVETSYMLDKLGCAVEAKATMNRLNKVIEETDGLGAAYMIGPAYFLKLGENGGDFNKLWEMNIEPLLKEYLRGFRKAKEILDKFTKAYFNHIDED